MTTNPVDQLVAILSGETPAPSPAPAPAPAPSDNPVDALIESRGLKYARGRVYLDEACIVAAARVQSTGTPEVVHLGKGKADWVVLWRTDDGDVVCQRAFAKK